MTSAEQLSCFFKKSLWWYYARFIVKIKLRNYFFKILPVVVQVVHLCIHHHSQYIYTKSHHLGYNPVPSGGTLLPPHKTYLFRT